MAVVPIRTQFIGILAADPATGLLTAGMWWFNSTEGAFKFYDGPIIIALGGTYNYIEAIPVESLGRPNTNPPTVVDQDNLTLLSFTVDTDKVTLKMPVPSDIAAGESLDFNVVWTNDGGVDDNGKNVKWQFDYQVGSEGDVISGNHANSPKTVEDTYDSALGWVEHDTAYISIPNADFLGKACIFIKISAITAPATVLTCEPHMIGICRRYVRQRRFI